MKAPLSLLLFLLVISACVSPANEGNEGTTEQGEWNPDLPEHFYEQGNDGSNDGNGVTNLRNPSQKDPLEKENRKNTAAPAPTYQPAYNLLRADRTVSLPDEMSDITGLGLSPDGRSLLALNYRDGDIYFIDKGTGELQSSTRFKHRGKYKGIEAVRNDVFIVKENGSIVHVTELDSEKPKSKTYDTPLNHKFSVHGLAYHPGRNELLLACQNSGDGSTYDDTKGIYAFDLETKELFQQPMFLLEDQDFQDYLDQQRPEPEEGDELFHKPPKYEPFLPTAIAIHPRSDEIFLISAPSMSLAILSADGKLLHIEILDPFLFNEPEGMCFDLDGTLYISSKGSRGSPAKIHRFSVNRRNRHPS